MWEKIQCNRFCFISVGVRAVLKCLVKIKKFEQYKKLPSDKFVKKKEYFAKHFVVCEIFYNYNVYEGLFTLNVLSDEVDRGPGYEKNNILLDKVHIVFC